MHGAHLGRHVAVGEGAAPRPGPDHRGAGLLVAGVQRRALHRLVMTAGEQTELDGRPRRPRCRRPDRRLVRAQSRARAAGSTRGGRAFPGTGPSSRSCSAWRARSSRSPRRPRASRPSRSRPRRRRRSIDRPPCRRSWESRRAGSGHSRYGADDLDPGRYVDGDEDAPARVVLDSRARLREQRVRRLAPAETTSRSQAIARPAANDDGGDRP